MANQLSLNWNLETLNKAYRQGYMAGLLKLDRSKCPYRGDVVVAAWEAGWEDGLSVAEQEARGNGENKIA
ncbi:ribosome modulation factor [Hahella sp. SMD15-11]|uniref:Ribosome modulation factor n=1 Tax=Thermohahella caldifontis TaxID=3142973 RepID=A0AB39URZ3_9GAMM